MQTDLSGSLSPYQPSEDLDHGSNGTMGQHRGSLRAKLELTLVFVGVLLLGLTPYPRAYTAALRQAESHRAAHETGAALDACLQATRLEPQAPLPWLHMGNMLLEGQRFVKAGLAFQEAERSGAGAEALLGLGQSQAGQGDWAAAMRTWLRALELAPDEANLYVLLARAAVAQGQFDLAASYLQQALQHEPSPGAAAEAHALLGRVLVATDPEAAAGQARLAGDDGLLALLETADAEPDPARRALLLGASFLQQSELSLARHHFEQAVTLAPSDTKARAYLAHTLELEGKTAVAREMLDQALALDPDSVLAHYFLALHWQGLGYVAGAQAELWEALRHDPENAALRVEMAETFVRLGDYAQADEWYQGAVEAAPDDVEFHLLLAHFYLDHLYRVEQGGLPAAQAAVELAPDDARAYDLLGWAYHLAGRPMEAQQALSRALVLDPDLASAHYHLGSLYAATGRPALARQHLQRAADLDTEGYVRRRAEALLNEPRQSK